MNRTDIPRSTPQTTASRYWISACWVAMMALTYSTAYGQEIPQSGSQKEASPARTP